ncbi:MAG: SUMF1/EgtB/PvdO family nonheme iron enzyme [Alloprevotella sp.]|nr:SUMF1/EgtB/PvdO family nonheme iron enzyme [Alloprevotella sp.]
MELKQGTLLQGGKYKIEATLGQGTFGITYLGTARFTIHGGLGAMEVVTKVAIKEFFMREMNVRDRDGKTVEGSSSSVFTNYRHRFRREAENLAKLDHPNIIRVYDVFDENGTTYYSMEYVEGLTLDAYIQQHHPLPEAEAVAILGRVCSALSFMHGQRMLHLDIKPKNIMYSTKGEVFLIDFGLSKQFGANGEPESSTTIGTGTPGYAPIEQVKQIKDGTFPATLDIYALGATIYKTFTGQRPPEATDILNDGFPDGPLVLCHRSPSLIKVIARCMSPMRKDRYQTVADLLRAYPALAAEDEKTEIKEVKEDTEATILNNNTGRQINLSHCSNKQCGKVIPSDAQFSPYCGTAVAKPGKSAAANKLDISVNGVTFTMVRVEGGTFTMGATSEQTGAFNSEKPAHQVTLSDYYIGQTEVTQALWKAVMGETPTSDGDQWGPEIGLGDNYPAYYISDNDVLSFISKLNSLTGRTFRMPTEAEWEYAARGGNKSKGYLYSGGNTLDNVGWYYENSSSKTHPVAQKSANELGLYDMSGNVWEWCSDWYGTYSSSSQTNPTGPSTGSCRVLRGGSWGPSARYCRVASRGYNSPSIRYYNFGIRLALSSSH